MRNIIELVKKDFKNLIRTRAGSLVIILGPLIVIFLAGIAFDNSNVYAVKIGSHVPSPDATTKELIGQLQKEFKVIEYNTQDECIDAIKETDVNTCMIFDANFTIGVPTKNQITFYVDYSRLNLVWTIMQTMTKEVGERSLQVGQNLTRNILDVLDYTTQRINDERAVMVRMTTENELMRQNTQDLITELSKVEFTVDEQGFQIGPLTAARTQVKQWTDNALSLGDKSLSKASSFIGVANDLIKSSSASSDVKDNLLASFQKSVAEIEALKKDMSSTKNLTYGAFSKFDEQIDIITEAIASTKDTLKAADTTKEMNVRILNAISTLLDQSMLSLSEVQKAFDDVQNRINAIEIRDPEAITQPIVTSIKPITQEKTYLSYLFPVLIVLIIMFTALLITPTLILLDKHSPASFRTFMTPVKDTSYVLANFITASIILFLQVIIILAIASVFFSSQIITNIPQAIVLLLLINSLFILMGMIIGYLFNSEETATLAGVSLGALFLFISDVIIPIESMPEAFAYIASFNPYVLGSSLLRRTLLFDSAIQTMYVDILTVLGYIAALTILALDFYMMTKRQSLQRLVKALTPAVIKKK